MEKFLKEKLYCGGVDWDEDEDPDIYEDPEDPDPSWDEEEDEDY